MPSELQLTPGDLFKLINSAVEHDNQEIAKKALEQFDKFDDENKKIFLDPTIEFIIAELEDENLTENKKAAEDKDELIGWHVNILYMIGGEKSFQSLLKILNITSRSADEKEKYRYTRFRSLRALQILAISKKQTDLKVPKELLNGIAYGDDEDLLVSAEALAILATEGDKKAKSEIKKWLDPQEFLKTLRMLRALREFPLPDFADEIIAVQGTSDYSDHKYEATLVLGRIPDNLKVVRTLGEIARTDPRSNIRLQAFKSLKNLRNRESISDLLHGLTDSNAENRLQACQGLELILEKKEEVVSLIINEALKETTDKAALVQFVEALRQIDKEKAISANILSRELNNEDQKRAQNAEKMLIELGGWAAVQRLNQRRVTLDALDKLLKDSEIVVRNTFEGTIIQAKRNFYFALGVNILVVITGIVLIGIAIKFVLQNPNSFAEWIIPGAAGVFGIILNMYFNDPRKNAREDLATLMNVNVIFLGYLRQLNEIDATFKHAYLERQDFGTDQMNETVTQICKTINQTLVFASNYLTISGNSNKIENNSKSINQGSQSQIADEEAS
jgi:hypothetical protein